jgi:hypothetical protein
MSVDPWSVLGIERGASPAVVRAAWRSAVFRYHPDRSETGDLAKYLEVDDAYRAITSEQEQPTPTLVTDPVPDTAFAGWRDPGTGESWIPSRIAADLDEGWFESGGAEDIGAPTSDMFTDLFDVSKLKREREREPKSETVGRPEKTKPERGESDLLVKVKAAISTLSERFSTTSGTRQVSKSDGSLWQSPASAVIPVSAGAIAFLVSTFLPGGLSIPVFVGCVIAIIVGLYAWTTVRSQENPTPSFLVGISALFLVLKYIILVIVPIACIAMIMVAVKARGEEDAA